MKCYVLLLCECSISGQSVYLESLNYAGKSPGVMLEIFSMGNSDAEWTSLVMTFSTETTTVNNSYGLICASQRSISPVEYQSSHLQWLWHRHWSWWVIHWFVQSILYAYYVSPTLLGTGGTRLDKTRHVPSLLELTVCEERQIIIE